MNDTGDNDTDKANGKSGNKFYRLQEILMDSVDFTTEGGTTTDILMLELLTLHQNT